MASTLLLHTIVWPLSLGVLLAFGLVRLDRHQGLIGLIVVIMLLTIYILLEGLPPIPPVSAKQKLTFVLGGAAIAATLAVRLRLNMALMIALGLTIAFVWLGWNKLAAVSAWPQSAALLAPVATSALASRSLEARFREPFLWPATLFAFAVGGSLLSLLGVFVGFAQDLGAMAAWLGGFMAACFGFTLAGANQRVLPPLAVWTVLFALVSMSFMVGLFAPDANLLAFAVLSLTLLVPAVSPEFKGYSHLIRPFMFGLLTVVPVAAAVLVALWQRGALASS